MPDIGENDLVPEKVVFIVIVIGNVSLEKQLLSSLVYWMYGYQASSRILLHIYGTFFDSVVFILVQHWPSCFYDRSFINQV